jgi:predicted DNA-binding transcriptional regulator AlpA
MEKTKKHLKIIGRVEAAKRLGLSAQALSCHVSRRNWREIPKPIKIGGCFKWVDSEITEFIEKKIREAQLELNPKKRGQGRPPKTRSASCT